MPLSDFTLEETATLLDAAETIAHNKNRCAVIVSGDKVVGMISEGDIIRALLRGIEVHAPLTLALRKDFKFLRERNLPQALDLFARYGFTLVPVVDEQLRLVDIVTLRDVLPHVAIRGSTDPC